MRRGYVTQHFPAVIVALFAMASISGCSNIDCPLDSVVVLTCAVESENNDYTEINVYASTGGKDSLLANGITPKDATFAIPVRHDVGTDTLLLVVSQPDGSELCDSVWITHTNEPHVEALDCPIAVFHHIQEIRHTYKCVDSVKLVRPNVNYEDITNAKIYMRPVR